MFSNFLSFILCCKFKFSCVESARYRKEEADRNGTILSEDYAEIIDEEGDYSTPASEYSQIVYTNEFL